MASLSQGRTAAAQCGLFTYESVPVIFEPPCMFARAQHRSLPYVRWMQSTPHTKLIKINFNVSLISAQTSSKFFLSDFTTKNLNTILIAPLCATDLNNLTRSTKQSIYPIFFTVRIVSPAHLPSWSIAHCRLYYTVYSIYTLQPEDTSYHDGKRPINMAFRTFWKL